MEWNGRKRNKKKKEKRRKEKKKKKKGKGRGEGMGRGGEGRKKVRGKERGKWKGRTILVWWNLWWSFSPTAWRGLMLSEVKAHCKSQQLWRVWPWVWGYRNRHTQVLAANLWLVPAWVLQGPSTEHCSTRILKTDQLWLFLCCRRLVSVYCGQGLSCVKWRDNGSLCCYNTALLNRVTVSCIRQRVSCKTNCLLHHCS